MRAGSECDRRVNKSACRAAAGEAGIDGIDVLVEGPHIQDAVRAKHRG
jgi:hypothetical protein